MSAAATRDSPARQRRHAPGHAGVSYWGKAQRSDRMLMCQPLAWRKPSGSPRLCREDLARAAVPRGLAIDPSLPRRDLGMIRSHASLRRSDQINFSRSLDTGRSL